MKLELFNNEAVRIWTRMSESEEKVADMLQLEVDLYKKLLVFFQIGESCYLFFNFQNISFDFISEEVKTMLGYPQEITTPEFFLDHIHPEDRAWFLGCQDTASQFLLGLNPEKQMKYKIRTDYRLKKLNGEYIRVMHQAVIIENDNAGKILRTLIVLTDITHLKKNGKSVMSYVGMDGEPSYLDVDVKQLFFIKSELLTKREREVLNLMAQGKLSKEIAEVLNVSKHTIDSHRKNMLSKTLSGSTAELVNKAIREGWI